MPLDRSRGLMRLVGLGKWMPTRNAIRSSQTPLQGGGSCLNGVFEIVCLGCYSGTYRVRTKLWVGMDGMAVRMWMRLGGCGCSRMYPVLSCVFGWLFDLRYLCIPHATLPGPPHPCGSGSWRTHMVDIVIYLSTPASVDASAWISDLLLYITLLTTFLHLSSYSSSQDYFGFLGCFYFNLGLSLNSGF